MGRLRRFVVAAALREVRIHLLTGLVLSTHEVLAAGAERGDEVLAHDAMGLAAVGARLGVGRFEGFWKASISCKSSTDPL